jgi:hypothetical protein
MGAVYCKRSGCPELGVGTSRFEPLSQQLGPLGRRDMVEVEDFDFSYSLYTTDLLTRVARFAYGRAGYREWARRSGRLEYIHSIDDRYDHDVDELMA